MNTLEELLVQLGAKNAEYSGFFNGYKVFEPQGMRGYIGLPIVIFEKDGEYRLSTPEETLDYLDWSIKHNPK